MIYINKLQFGKFSQKILKFNSKYTSMLYQIKQLNMFKVLLSNKNVFALNKEFYDNLTERMININYRLVVIFSI